MRDYSNRTIPDMAALIKHIGDATNVECVISDVPFLKAKGLYSIPTISYDLVRIANKYGLTESTINEDYAIAKQLSRVLNALIARNIISEQEIERYFED